MGASGSVGVAGVGAAGASVSRSIRVGYCKSEVAHFAIAFTVARIAAVRIAVVSVGEGSRIGEDGDGVGWRRVELIVINIVIIVREGRVGMGAVKGEEVPDGDGGGARPTTCNRRRLYPWHW